MSASESDDASFVDRAEEQMIARLSSINSSSAGSAVGSADGGGGGTLRSVRSKDASDAVSFECLYEYSSMMPEADELRELFSAAESDKMAEYGRCAAALCQLAARNAAPSGPVLAQTPFEWRAPRDSALMRGVALEALAQLDDVSEQKRVDALSALVYLLSGAGGQFVDAAREWCLHVVELGGADSLLSLLQDGVLELAAKAVDGESDEGSSGTGSCPELLRLGFAALGAMMLVGRNFELVRAQFFERTRVQCVSLTPLGAEEPAAAFPAETENALHRRPWLSEGPYLLTWLVDLLSWCASGPFRVLPVRKVLFCAWQCLLQLDIWGAAVAGEAPRTPMTPKSPMRASRAWLSSDLRMAIAAESFVFLFANNRLMNLVMTLLKVLLASSPTVRNYNGSVRLESEVDSSEADWQRHRQIVAKLVSVVLLLLLKAFRRVKPVFSESVLQCMADSNCILLILKYFNQDLRVYFGGDPSMKPDDNGGGGGGDGGGGDGVAALNGPSDLPIDDTGAVMPAEAVVAQAVIARNVFTSINLLRILRRVCSDRPWRIRTLMQYKAPVILRRSRRIGQLHFSYYLLRVMQLMVRYQTRKWRSSNMAIVDSIYRHLPPRMGDDWTLCEPEALDEADKIASDEQRFRESSERDLQLGVVAWARESAAGAAVRRLRGASSAALADSVSSAVPSDDLGETAATAALRVTVDVAHSALLRDLAHRGIDDAELFAALAPNLEPLLRAGLGSLASVAR